MKTALNIFLIIALFLFTACGGGGSTVILPPTAPPPEPDPTPETSRTIFVYDNQAPEIGTSDGEFYYELAQEKAANARSGFISIGDILHGIDDTGESIISQRLPTAPNKIAISGQDIWCFKNIHDAMSGRDYTEIWLNNSQYGNWTDNRYTVAEAIVTDSGDIIVLDTGGKYRNILEPAMVVNYAGHGGILIHSIDVATHRANIDDTRVAFSTNYFFGAKQWVEADGVYYSWNGYTWDGTTLTERATIMHEFVTSWWADRPVLVPVGSRIEHGEAVTYWIECNTGWMYRHTPSIDSLEVVARLYQGSGDRSDGLAARGEIKPVLVSGYDGDNLYFGWDGTIWKYNFNDALVSSFAAGVEIWKL
jgi:hypothetical protein